MVIILVGLFGGGSAGGIIVTSSFLAEEEDINSAYIYYTSLEIGLIEDIINTDIGGFNEVFIYLNGSRLSSTQLRNRRQQWLPTENATEVMWSISAPLRSQITHNPFRLMAYLTAAHEDFVYPYIRSTIQELFSEQYYLATDYQAEERYIVEERTGYYTDYYGYYQTYVYYYTFEYVWTSLFINLTVNNKDEIILERLNIAAAALGYYSEEGDYYDNDLVEHFRIIMYFHGHVHFVGTPFDFYWLPFVSSHFGYRLNPFSRQRQLHNGVDIALPEGTPILAAHDGEVVTSGYSPSFGNWIVIEEDDGENTIRTLYAHLHERFVFVGDIVSESDIIGTVGTTGASTGNHLHFEVILNGRHFNPVFFAYIPLPYEYEYDYYDYE
ncbi:MAG: M23 family metallopeptidase [Defluviitaleaceae bacterium]|nr:M23 family metallopeptidase [Defluviitaleaceae bacterium]